ncbi:MAG TPA: glycosyltransferase family 1 protein [Chryseosolibacter sp.]
MNIGFEAKRFFTNYTGLGNYSRFVIDALSQTYPQNNLYLYSPRVVDHVENQAILTRKNIQVIAPSGIFAMPVVSALWRTWAVSKNSSVKHLNLFHGLSQELPVGLPRHIKKVVTVHDLIFLRYPQFYNAVDVAIYKRKVQLACEMADKIIAISQQTADDIKQFLKVDKTAKIEVVYQGCHPIFKKEISKTKFDEVRKKYSLPGEFVLSVGTVEERKNLMLVIKAIALLPKAERLPLVVVGRHTGYYHEVVKEIERAGLSDIVRFLTNVAFHDLPALYRLAKLFVYPSRFEGFGIPLVEAITCGIPPITSTGSCFQEAAGAGGVYVNPDDADALAREVKELVNNDLRRKELIAAGQKHIQQFEPTFIAQRLNDVYRAVVPEESIV